MKKITLLFICLFLLFGCSNKFNNDVGGKIYNIISLQDKGINMFQGVIPENWKASISSQNLVNSSYPFVETVVINSPDNSAKITILSQHSYVENNKYKEGENKDYYTTYLRQMNAKEYLDYFMSVIYKGSTYVKDGEVDSQIDEQFKTLHNMKIEAGKKDAQLLMNNSRGVSLSVNGVNCTSSKREYENGLNYFEASTSVSAISTRLTSSVSDLLNSYAVQWYMPYIIIYQGETKEDYDKYYDDYLFIIANSNFTLDYYRMIEYVSSAIVNAYTSIYAEKSKIGLEAMNNYIDSNYSSTSSSSTNDRVMEMWDDVIKEVDSYKLEDGTTFKTSIMNDTVAQKGNEIYVGTKAGIPLGFNELSKGY